MQIRPYDEADANAVNAVALAALAQYRGIYRDWETLTRGVGANSKIIGQRRMRS